ncbi:MAG: NifB/NifX family molybdenum-iron cluster-binding protein [Peptostreptococcaceae bacterium]|nr:NifB/NifX family molybdenum-iron cluster-binding protein [Peptostreptococcaceae bacterium]
MIISVACDGKNVAQHFGHCESFALYTEENGKIVSTKVVGNPGHKPGVLPNFLADNGAKVIIAGGMGGGAVDIFNSRDIEVIIGASGDALGNVEAYLAGKLVTTGSICHEHEHADECQ